MSIESEPKQCPKCGGPIPAEAPQGLCPKCLMQQASFATEAGSGSQGKSAPPTREELGTAFPHLEILELIGQGGMGFVFKARQPKLDRFVALKILPQSLAADPAFAERFTREGRMLARLNHPNIVTIHDFGQANGFFYLLMEFVDGVNLRQAMKVGRFTPAQALTVVPKICEALQFAHNEGILHRDIKPENILLDSKGRVKIADFGIAKLVGGELRSQPSAAASPLSDERAGASGALSPGALTETGKALGTPQYMAPEQIEHPQDVDHRADIYSLGVVFYEMLTGELPIGRFAPPSQKSAVDPRMDEVVLRALERERERRTQTAQEVKTQVETVASTRASPGPATLPETQLVLGFATLVVAGISGWWFARNYYRIGPEPLEPLVLIGGAALVIAAGAFGFLQLVRGVKRLGTITSASPISPNPETPVPVRVLAYLALGLVLAATLGTIMLMALSAREDAALVFGGSALALSIAFAVMSRTERLGRLVLKANIAILAIVGLVLAISIPLVAIRRADMRAQADMHANKAQREMELERQRAKDLRANVGEKQGAGSTVTYKSSPVTRGDMTQVVNAAGTLSPVAGTPAKWQIDAMVAEEDVANVEDGQDVRFTMDAFPARAFTGRVLRVSNAPSKVQNVVAYGAAIEVNNADPKFKPGMTAWVSFIVAHRQDVLKIPNAVLRFRMPEGPPGASGGPPIAKAGPQSERTVWVLRGNENSKPEPVTIQTGIGDGTFTEVTDGLKEGDRVIIGWTGLQPATPPTVAPASASVPSSLGPVVETVLKSAEGRSAELLDLDTGKRVSSATFGENDRDTHAWVRSNRLDVLGVIEKDQVAILCMDMAVIPAISNGWERASASDVAANRELAQIEPNKITVISPLTDRTDSWLFRTREGTLGVLQILGPNENPHGVRVRFKLVQATPVSGNGPLTKTIVLARAGSRMIGDSNGTWTVTVWSDTTLHPGEILQARQRLPDGETKNASTSLHVTRTSAGTATSSGFTWFFSEPFGEREARDATEHLQQRLSGRPLELATDEPLALFSVTNKFGGVLSAFLEFKHVAPDPPIPITASDPQAHATVRLKPPSGTLVYYSAEVPPGYALQASANYPEAEGARASTTSQSGPYGYDSSWYLPEVSYEQQRDMAPQVQRLAEQGPLEVVFGQPRVLFSVTNTIGEVVQGCLELLGPVERREIPEERKPIRPGALTNSTKAAMPNAQPVKTMVLTGVTNELLNADLRIVRVHTDTTLIPGETLVGMAQKLDGQIVDNANSFFINRVADRVETSCYFAWTLPDSFTPEDFELAATQIRQNQTGRPLTLAPGKPIEMFSVTNGLGGVVRGFIRYERFVPNAADSSAGTGAKAQATVRLRPYGSGLLAFSTASVPPGYFLEAADNSSEVGGFGAHTSADSSSWSPPSSFTYEQQREAVAQLQRLAENGPIRVTYGEPFQLFSFTNKARDVYRGYFELVGPPAPANQ